MMSGSRSSPAEFSGTGLRCLRGERVVFTGLDFSLEAGDALVLSGPNGSGKSSLLRVMAGLLPPVEGSLLRQGVDIAADPEPHRTSLHYVGHLDALKPVLTVRENLTFWAGMRPVEGDIGKSVAIALETFALSALQNLPARLLSAGQQRRLNLARLVASEAPLWLLDEPTVALDRASVERMTGLIADHRGNGGMVVLSTHIDLGIQDAKLLALDDFSAPTEEFAC